MRFFLILLHCLLTLGACFWIDSIIIHAFPIKIPEFQKYPLSISILASLILGFSTKQDTFNKSFTIVFFLILQHKIVSTSVSSYWKDLGSYLTGTYISLLPKILLLDEESLLVLHFDLVLTLTSSSPSTLTLSYFTSVLITFFARFFLLSRVTYYLTYFYILTSS